MASPATRSDTAPGPDPGRPPDPAGADGPAAPPPLPKLVAAFAVVYVIWGSTYLAIRYAIETIPPFTMAGARFLVAGLILYAWTRRVRGVRAPTGSEWRAGAVVGALLLLGGNGGVVWAEQYVPSGLAALLVATVPLWMVLLDWLGGGVRPSAGLAFGLLWGLAGVALLVSGESIGAASREALLGGLAVLVGSFLWALGSIHSRRAPLPAAPRMGTAVQMLCGGAGLLVLGAATGELGRIDPAAVSTRSLLALAYLVVFGSLVAYSAYIWLLRATTAARVSTYAYVNPVVALVLGWALAGEPLTSRTLVAAGVILSSVMLINARGGRRTPPDRGAPGRASDAGSGDRSAGGGTGGAAPRGP